MPTSDISPHRKHGRTPPCINGSENLEDVDAAAAALIRFYRAFNERDLAQMELTWVQDSDASMSNPIGGVRRGWEEIREGYSRLFNGSTRVYVEFYDYTIQGDGRFALAVGRERGWFERHNQRLQLAIRTSRLLVRQQGLWLQIHHHGSIEDGELLSSYQTAVLGEPLRMAIGSA